MAIFIDRDQAIDILRNTPLRVTGVRAGKPILSQYAEGCRATLVEAVEELKPAEDIDYVRHGYWISHGKTGAGTTILECSRCNKVRKGGGKSAYCRDCGAKMDISIEIPKVRINWRGEQ